MVADILEARHEQEGNEAGKDDSSGDREVGDGGLLRALTLLSKTDLGGNLDSKDDDTSNSVAAHNGGDVLGREHGSKTEESSNQDSRAETADRGHSQDNTERGLIGDHTGRETVLHGNDDEDNNLNGKTEQKAPKVT